MKINIPKVVMFAIAITSTGCDSAPALRQNGYFQNEKPSNDCVAKAIRSIDGITNVETTEIKENYPICKENPTNEVFTYNSNGTNFTFEYCRVKGSLVYMENRWIGTFNESAPAEKKASKLKEVISSVNDKGTTMYGFKISKSI